MKELTREGQFSLGTLYLKGLLDNEVGIQVSVEITHGSEKYG
jgi:hypothetical protein